MPDARSKGPAHHCGEIHFNDASGEALKFFDWAYRKGDELAEALDYAPMPDNVVGLVQEEWATIKDPAGKPIFATN